MNTETSSGSTTHNIQHDLHLIAVLKAALQSLVTLYNLVGDQEGAHRCSKELCAILAIEFRLLPYSRRTRGGF